MRLTSFGIIFVLMTACWAHAQIPERVLFQPGSYAYGMNQGGMYQRAPQAGRGPVETVLIEVPEETVISDDRDDAEKTEWEKDFGTAEKKVLGSKLVEMQIPAEEEAQAVQSMPYLAYHRNPWTHRIHVIPYQKGYPEGSEDFPKHQSKWNLWTSSLPCKEQNRPQVQYLGYYDPMPEIIQDKPSRIQLLLGYENSAWTSCCDNRWGYRMAQCPGVERIPCGPSAEQCIRNQPIEQAPQGPMGGIFAGPRPIQQGGFAVRQYPCPYPNCPCETQPMPPAPPKAAPCPCPQKTCCDCEKPSCTTCKDKPSCGKKSCKTCVKKVAKKQPSCAPPAEAYPLKSDVAE